MRGMDTVVVGYDGSSNARRALEAAADAVADDGVVHVVTAYHPPSSANTAQLWSSLPDEFKRNFDVLAGPRADLDEAERVLKGRGVTTKGHLVGGGAAHAILDTADAEEADLIVVGSRGLGQASRFVRGSVSARIANHAHTSFLVVLPHDEDD